MWPLESSASSPAHPPPLLPLRSHRRFRKHVANPPPHVVIPMSSEATERAATSADEKPMISNTSVGGFSFLNSSAASHMCAAPRWSAHPPWRPLGGPSTAPLWPCVCPRRTSTAPRRPLGGSRWHLGGSPSRHPSFPRVAFHCSSTQVTALAPPASTCTPTAYILAPKIHFDSSRKGYVGAHMHKPNRCFKQCCILLFIDNSPYLLAFGCARNNLTIKF